MENGNSFYVTAFSKVTKLGPYVCYFENGQEIHYCVRSQSGDVNFKIRAHGKQGMMSFETTTAVNGLYECDGETIIIVNDSVEYKKYFLEGVEVDWDKYKKNRPEDRLDIKELEKLQAVGNQKNQNRSIKINELTTEE